MKTFAYATALGLFGAGVLSLGGWQAHAEPNRVEFPDLAALVAWLRARDSEPAARSAA